MCKHEKTNALRKGLKFFLFSLTDEQCHQDLKTLFLDPCGPEVLVSSSDFLAGCSLLNFALSSYN